MLIFFVFWPSPNNLSAGYGRGEGSTITPALTGDQKPRKNIQSLEISRRDGGHDGRCMGAKSGSDLTKVSAYSQLLMKILFLSCRNIPSVRTVCDNVCEWYMSICRA